MGLYVFDAYGTLFDVHAAAERHKDAIGPRWQQLSQTWRAKHIEYSWHVSLAGRRAMFWSLAERSLDYAIASVGGGVSSDVRGQTPGGIPDDGCLSGSARACWTRSRRAATRWPSCRTATPTCWPTPYGRRKLEGVFDAVLSVVSAGIFKPSMKVYQLVIDRFGGAPADVSFQSSNRWDIAGAKAFGFTCVWINRTGALDEYPDLPPDRVVSDLRALVA